MLQRNLLYSTRVTPRSTWLRQRGLGAFGALVVLALVAVAGYYLYMQFSGGDATPSCASQFQSCMRACNRSQTDNSGMQACRSKCESDQSFCSMAAKRNANP